MPIVTKVPMRSMVATTKAECAGIVGIAFVGRGTPIAAVLTNIVTQRPVAVTRNRKKDTISV
ncbi:MAG: hypothetical protein IKJ67_11035 [Bacteroidales bacterium]|nr:hypothetical protein [Bacteroidales bacterium]